MVPFLCHCSWHFFVVKMCMCLREDSRMYAEREVIAFFAVRSVHSLSSMLECLGIKNNLML